MKFRTLVWYGFAGSLGFVLGSFLMNFVINVLFGVMMAIFSSPPQGPAI